ncbi:acyltransferase family protein [Massilia sp. DWR3-1-1]|uniref:acyltransferase family protein n=1 Tax=Massilia sp. DWR3-1-1 TaxID=2804559 RepID=UPI003CEC5077
MAKVAVSHQEFAYRSDIDGLRAIAVLSVVLFHAFPKWFSGGFVGVDIFFVISGFLISGIIFRELDQGIFSFLKFYARRARRIFPALLLVLLVTCLVGWYVLTPDEFAQLGKHAAAGAGFFSNIAMWLEVGYFDTSSDTKPLLHLWSLGVEEQFYIFFPLLLVVAHRTGMNKLLICIAIAVMSFALNVFLVNSHADFVFYMPFTRLWELLAGSVLAYTSLRSQQGGSAVRSATSIHLLSAFGLIGILSGFAIIDESLAFPGWWALLPVSGTVLLIAVGPTGIANRFLLSNPLMRWIGIISYPAYLWHWPLLSFGKIISGSLSKESRICLIVGAFALAYATYMLLEKKIRFGRKPNDGESGFDFGIVAKLYFGLAFMGIFGLLVMGGVLPSRSTNHDLDQLLAAQYDWGYPPRSFTKINKGTANFFMRSTGVKSQTLFIGDSIVEQYAPRLEFLLSSPGAKSYQSIIFATGPGCPPIPGVVHRLRHTHPTCVSTTAAAFAIAHSPDVNVVVIGGNWDNYLSNKNRELVFNDGKKLLPYTQNGAVEAALASLAKEVESLSRTKRVYILLNSPKGLDFSPKSMLTGSRLTTLNRQHSKDTASIQEFLDGYAPIRSRLVEMARRSGAQVVDPLPILCHDAICPTVAANGDPLFMDTEHMRPFYVRERATFIDQFIEAPVGRLARPDPIEAVAASLKNP